MCYMTKHKLKIYYWLITNMNVQLTVTRFSSVIRHGKWLIIVSQVYAFFSKPLRSVNFRKNTGDNFDRENIFIQELTRNFFGVQTWQFSPQFPIFFSQWTLLWTSQFTALRFLQYLALKMWQRQIKECLCYCRFW